MEDLWTMFCGETSCSSRNGSGSPCPSFFESVIHPSSCTNHAMIICFDAFLILIFFNMVRKSSLKLTMNPASYGPFSPLQVISAAVNGCAGLVYLCFSIWILEEKLRKTRSPLPLHWWMLSLFQELALLVIGITVSLQGRHLTRAPLLLLSVPAFLFAAFGCTLSIFAAVVDKEAAFKTALDLLSFVGASLLLLCTYKCYKNEESYDIVSGTDPHMDSIGYITPFSKGGVFSRMTFWWLNTLMKKGWEKTLEDDDIPELREADRAEICYLHFIEQLNKQKQDDPSSQPSILIAIVRCHWNEIFVSGFFALLKILFLSSGPLLLNAFIQVVERKQDFKYEGYVLAMSLFFTKSLESLSQRQWNFRSRLIGIQVRSSLTAAIYRKQLRASNAAKLMHSSGQIINYATVDAYRIGEFPFWFHQTWTTSLQICLALLILFHAVGLATIAALVVILITVLCNIPLAKLQQKFHNKLMAAKDEKLKASSEALVNMKVLKLYAWETHFKGVVENLRKVEQKWLSAVQLQKAFASFIVWSSPVLVSAAILGACYFLGVPLYASNVFTMVATLRLLQNPIRAIPGIIGAVIQAKVAFARVVKFLEAPGEPDG